jgi:transcriptional regulator with XRE-family HTH domain
MNTRDIVASQIRKARLAKDWTQEYCAEKIGVSGRAWVKYEATGGVPVQRLVQIADLFEKTLDWFVGREAGFTLPKAQSSGARAKRNKVPIS